MNDCHSSKNIARNLSNHSYRTTEPFFHSNVALYLYQQQHQNRTAERNHTKCCLLFCSNAVMSMWHGSIPKHIFLYFGIHSGLACCIFYVLSCANCRNIVIFSFFCIYINVVSYSFRVSYWKRMLLLRVMNRNYYENTLKV